MKNEFKYIFSTLFLILFPSVYIATQGINWSDSGQIFYFGNKILHGAFPYRDFSYQTGWIPIWADAMFQKWFGSVYISSLAAGLVVKTLTLLIVYGALRRFASCPIASIISIGLSLTTLDLVDGGNEYWANLFLISSVYFWIYASKSTHLKRSLLLLFTSGFSLSLVTFARQTNGIVCFILVLTLIFTSFFRNKALFKQNRMIFFVIGALAGYVVVMIFLAFHGALTSAMSELLINAAERKNFHIQFAVIDAMLGGAAFTASNAKSFLKIILCNALPLFSILFAVARSRGKRRYDLILISVAMMVGLVLPEIARIVIGHDHSMIQNISDILVYDVPRVYLTWILLIFLFLPKTFEWVSGNEKNSVLFLVSLTLGSVWAMQMSWIGRGYVKVRMLMMAIWLLVAMSDRMSDQLKRRLSISFLLVCIFTFLTQSFSYSLGQEGIWTGFYKTHHYKIAHPILKHIKVSQSKADTYLFLKKYIQPGDSCFFYGSAPIFYLMLPCANPTQLDIAYPDALTLSSAQAAISQLRNHPPKWIIETQQLRAFDLEGINKRTRFAGPADQPGPKALRAAMHDLITNYELIPNPSEVQANSNDLDHAGEYRLYRFHSASNKL